MSHFNQNLDPAKQTDQSEGRKQDQGSTNGFNGNGYGAAPVAAGANREQVLIEFQQSMLQITKSFLEAQQQVMMAYLGQTSPQPMSQPQFQSQLQPQFPTQNQSYVAPPAYVEPAPAAIYEQTFESQSHPSVAYQVAPETFQAPPETFQAAPEAFQIAPDAYQTTPTVAPAPVTEVYANPSVAQTPADAFASPVASTSPVAVSTASPSEGQAATLSAEALVETLIDIVSERTGYPKEMLDPTLDMEADLGIDSIKKIEILNALRKLLPPAKQAQIEESMERIATIKTLQGVMDWIRDEFGDQAATTPAAAMANVAPAPSLSATPAVASTPAPLAVAQPAVASSLPSSTVKPKGRLKGCTVSQPESGVVAFTVAFGPDNDLYLNDHKFNQVPVMPMAAALELMAEAACSVYPGFTLSSVENLDIPAGITFEGGAKDLTVVVKNAHATANGAQSDHVSVSTAVTTGGANGRVHFKAKIELLRHLNGRNGTPSAETLAAFPALRNPEGRLPTIDEIYGKLMFHGPLMQGICQVTELGEDGISGVLRPSDIKRCVRSANGDNWIIDPILLDSAMQLAGIWARHYHDIMVLPTGFTRLSLYQNGTDSGSFANLTGKIHVPVEYDKGQLLCDLAIYDDGKPVMIVEGLGGVGSKSFNKLAAQS